MTTQFVYPAILTPDEGKMVVEFPDIPEALTVGSDEAEACVQAADCLDEAIEGRIIRRDVIPHLQRSAAARSILRCRH